MPNFKAPVRDMNFVINEVLESDKFYAGLAGFEEVSSDLTDAIFNESAKFCEEVLAPLYQSGDEEGCQWSEEGVTTPQGFAPAYQQFVENGWPALSAPQEYGGQGLPSLLGFAVSEMTSTANWGWAMFPGLGHGAICTIEEHGDDGQKSTYLEKLISGHWTGSMCLTEAHCGSDLGQLRTKAEPCADGSYAISGTKIFISSGEHDMAENIIHIVLARMPDAPAGTKGISLFIVPKFHVNDDGSLGERNAVHCASIEKKMGIKASATCVMNFDGATGYLIGPPNKGLNCMFTFMNIARLGTAVQGVCHAERSYQGAVEYARERLAMRSLTGPKNPDGPADPIIVHPDVRRMLLTQKAVAEGGRAFLYYLSQLSDLIRAGDQDRAEQADELMALLTPIAKAFITELGFEAANHGVQVYGGHGFIREWGMEQIVRDARISTIYEGTTGIQALDLLGRKVLASGGSLLRGFTDIIDQFCRANTGGAEGDLINTLSAYKNEWLELTMQIGQKAMQNPDEVGAASVDYLMYAGYVTVGYFWAKMAVVARARLEQNPADKDFYLAKLHTARFYFERLLPRADSHKRILLSGANNLMDIEEKMFAL